MALPIIEEPIYGQIAIETSAWSTPFSWVDRTADLVNGITYSEGGRIGIPGASLVDVGTLNATFKNASTIPNVGDLVRLRRAGTTEYAFTGYVQDVSQRVVFDNSVSLTTPITLTTIYCLDWVGYISQFQAVGAGGADASTGTTDVDSQYRWYNRVAALNKIVDPTYATKIIEIGPYVVDERQLIGDTDFVGTFAEHLDLLANSTGIWWWGTHNLPTNKTTGRTSLVSAKGFIPPVVKTFTDVLGTSGQLHYTEIDFENTTQNIANTLIANNRFRFNVSDLEVTKIGGFNDENYMVINDQNVVGVPVEKSEIKIDTTSVSTYGIRQSVVDVNVSLPASATGSFNLVTNPSLEYSDDGYSGGANVRVRRRKPSEDASPFAAYDGLWAIRVRQSTANATGVADFSGGESDSIAVVAGRTYYGSAWAARGTPSPANARVRARIIWMNDDEATISTVSGAYVNLTNANTWYQATTGALVAPAGAVRAKVGLEFSRTSGANISVGDIHWGDAYMLSRTADAYFDGDTPWTATNGYFWTGGVGASPSYKVLNSIDDVATTLLTKYSSTSMRATRIRWNAQEDLTAVSSLSVGRNISLVYKGTTTTYKIIGIDGNVSPDRYVIDYYLAKA